MRLDDPEWMVARLAAKQLNCTPERFVAFATTHLGQMLLAGPPEEREALARSIKAVMREPDIFAELRGADSPASLDQLRKAPRSSARSRRGRPVMRDGSVRRARGDRVFVANDEPESRPKGLTHNPFASLLKPED